MTYRYFALAGLFYLLLTGCGADVKTEIIAEWEGQTAKQDLVFHEDGRIEMKGHNHGVYEGHYIIEDGNKLTCNFLRLSQPVKCTAKIHGDELILVHPGGREEVYHKK